MQFGKFFWRFSMEISFKSFGELRRKFSTIFFTNSNVCLLFSFKVSRESREDQESIWILSKKETHKKRKTFPPFVEQEENSTFQIFSRLRPRHSQHVDPSTTLQRCNVVMSKFMKLLQTEKVFKSSLRRDFSAASCHFSFFFKLKKSRNVQIHHNNYFIALGLLRVCCTAHSRWKDETWKWNEKNIQKFSFQTLKTLSASQIFFP